jgi:hypothetical protein
VAVLARLFEILTGVSQLLNIFPLHDIQNLETDIAECLDPRVPLDRVFSTLALI